MQDNPVPQAATQVTPAVPRKGLGTAAKIGIGCGAVVMLAVLALVIGLVLLGGKLTDFADEMHKNPTRATASLMVKASVGTLEWAAEDDVNKRYTLRETKSGKLTTIYWNPKTQAPEVIEGDFSSIPSEVPGEEHPESATAE